LTENRPHRTHRCWSLTHGENTYTEVTAVVPISRPWASSSGWTRRPTLRTSHPGWT
ncbi:unnamed protein product, partial [Pylaiella littoralis]